MSSLWTDIIDRCEAAVDDNDNSVFTAEEIARWVNDAVRDLSQHFPRVKTQTISAAVDTNNYDLETDFLGVISVEYPDGEDPPEYLSRLSHTHADFWTADSWYDIIPRKDDTDPSEIWISDDPAGTESIVVYYNARHDLIANPRSVSGSASLQPQHQPLIIKFVLWQSTMHLLMAEQQAPTSNSSLLMAQLAQNTRRMEASYHTAVAQAVYAADGEGRIVSDWVNNSGYSTGNSLSRIY